MDKIILNFPKQFKKGIEAAQNVKVKDGFEGVVVCAMGGSALPGDVLEMWLAANKIDLPLYVHRSYGLPHFVDEKHLVVCISYSGNTEETISAFKEALRQKLSLAAISSGGEIAKLSGKHNVPLAKMPSGTIPRLAIGYQFGALIKILANSGIIQNELKEVIALEKQLQPRKLKEQARKLAQKLIGKIPIIYSSAAFKSLAVIWKINLNENAKVPAFANYFPELSHNEIVGFSGRRFNKDFLVIILENHLDPPRILKQIRIAKSLLKDQGVKVESFNMTGKGILEKVFSSIILASWTSFWLAKAYQVNPIKVKIVDEVKKRLK